jgi:hypothetical protein
MKTLSLRATALLLSLSAGCAGDLSSEDPAAADVVEQQSSALVFSGLPLGNGWTNGPFGTSPASSALDAGVVRLKGAIATAGASAVPSTLPAGQRPSTNVYVPVNLCSATKGRLFIQPSGVVTVQAEGNVWANAQCFTSLDGASFPVSTAGYTTLALQNGWTHAPFGTRAASAKIINDVVTLAGAIASGTSASAFRLPLGMAPSTQTYVPVDTCAATKGRLSIDIAGNVTIQTEGAFSNAQCFTSLEGVSFPLTPAGAGYTCPSPLANGWVGMPFQTRNPCFKNISGVVHMLGAVASGTAGPIFTLPAGFRPAKDTYVEADLCGATKGRVLIQPSGVVSAQSQGAFSNAQCFTSLEGVTFGL